jgi:hypothetical protein
MGAFYVHSTEVMASCWLPIQTSSDRKRGTAAACWRWRIGRWGQLALTGWKWSLVAQVDAVGQPELQDLKNQH